MKPRHVILTGVSRGLGRAMAIEFAKGGHFVNGCCRNPADAAALREQLGPPHQIEVVDVTDENAVAAWASATLAARPAPDLLINNAGLINRSAPLWEVPANEFNTVVDVNLKGVANVIRHFVPAMVARGKGVIINFSSGWGRSTSAEVAPYCATKWAIEGLTKALAQELPEGLAAVPLNPGVIDTRMLRSCFGDAAAGYPSAEDWARRAVQVLLQIGAAENGRSLSL
jgi:NAD(P)-dependent dehydrogenase (short-subunit alcohol dehydrogenase family)